MNQTYRIGDQVVIYKVGTVIEAKYDEIAREVKYTVRFEDGKEYFGCAIVTDKIMTQPAAQVLKQSEIEALRDGGIAV